MLQRLARTLAINLVVFIVLAEIVALGVYYVQNGSLFYISRKTYKPIGETQQQSLTPVALHPYFGPTHKPGHPFSAPESLQKNLYAGQATNNFGFVSRHDYPYARVSDDEFIVGIFGGSVAQWFCQLGAERLVQDLEPRAPFKSKRLTPLCFSHEGYKQPQQALLLAYFLSIGQPFDLVINIDGFNEVALGRLNDEQGLDISMPSVMHIGPLIDLANQSTLTPEKLDLLAQMARDRQRLNTVAGWINANRIASVNLALEQYYQRLSNRYLNEQFAFSKLPPAAPASSLVYVTPRTKQRAGDELYQDIAREWASGSRLMSDLLAARSIPYVHVLQPNQYFTSRRFSDAEAKVAFNAQSPFAEGVRKGYPVLQKSGIRFLDATRIFDRESSAVYIDDCCHYTVLGNRLLADFIADGIVSSIASGPTARE